MERHNQKNSSAHNFENICDIRSSVFNRINCIKIENPGQNFFQTLLPESVDSV